MKCTQKLYPPNVTQVLLCIDRHIGIQYKSEVYNAIRRENLQRLQEDRGSAPGKLGALAKRVIITKLLEMHMTAFAKVVLFGDLS